MEKIDILGVKINKLTFDQVLEKINNFLVENNKNYISTVNPEFIMAALKDDEFKRILNNSSLAIPDGIGMLWAAKYLNWKSNLKNKFLLRVNENFRIMISGISLIFYPRFCKSVLQERISGVDLMWEIAKIGEHKNCSIFFLGGFDKVGEYTSKKMKAVYPNLNIAGVYEGTYQEGDDYVIQELINKSQADVVFVAFGQVKQEKWIVRNLPNLSSVKLAMGVGGSFDFIAGKAKRAPRFFQKIGLEWLWRVLFEPWRFGRIITATFKFTHLVYKSKIDKYN
ncbi:MAG: WecB/TagA/CpsF family glycosyltransferase [Patescibacteria group bacterium]|jgi:N-acetylglucosaminyldiphosphoundecaprenol N-acetyl-beta-D-mannosaminyltransferase